MSWEDVHLGVFLESDTWRMGYYPKEQVKEALEILNYFKQGPHIFTLPGLNLMQPP
jgi:hypothetical protein